jgi:hypothetical protein
MTNEYVNGLYVKNISEARLLSGRDQASPDRQVAENKH